MLTKNPSLTLVVATSITLALSGCGGGGSGPGPMANGGSNGMMDDDSNGMMDDGSMASAPSSAGEILDFAVTRPAVNDLLSNARAAVGDVAVYTGAEVTDIATSFDGQRATVTVNRSGANSVSLDTDDPYWDSGNGPSLVNLPQRTGRYRYVFDYTNTSATIGLVAVDWANADLTDYLAGGYWMHVETDPVIVEVGAFVDGPELSLTNPANLPVSGTASYEGDSTGVYAYHYGSDDPLAASGSQEVGNFYGVATFTADFSAGTIQGCLGCEGPLLLSGVTHYSDTGQTEGFEDFESDFRLNFGTAPINRSDATFQGTDVTTSHPPITFSQSSGNWGGQFSSRSNSSGNPRLVAGTFDGQAATAGGSLASFVGAFAAGE